MALAGDREALPAIGAAAEWKESSHARRAATGGP